jgi:Uma2 family endonuclease
MDAVKSQLLTAEDFWLLPESETRRSLVRGEVIETMPPGGQHGVIDRSWISVSRRGPGAKPVSTSG